MRLGGILFGALALAGCVTASNKLPLEQVVDLRVGEITVSMADGSQIPADLRNVVASKVKMAMERQLSPRLKGSNAVRVDVNVKSITITPEVQQVLGGGQHGMVADVTLIDLRTKAVLLTYDAQSIRVGAGGGIGGLVLDRAILPAPIDRITENFAFQYAEWLKPSEPRS